MPLNPKPLRMAGAVARSLFVSWLIAAAVVYCGQRWLLYPTYMVPDWSGWSWPGVQRVEVPTTDGETLKAFWRPPTDGGGVVITFHGNGSLPEPHAERFATAPWSLNGWGFLAIAYRGYPGSTGSPSEEGLLRDADAAVAFAKAKAPGSGLLFHGHSLGSGVAVAMAARHPSKGLYLEAAYPSITEVAAHRIPFMPTSLMWDTFRSADRIGRVAAPIVMVHGSDDAIIPPAMARALAAQAAPPVTVVLVDADHMSVLGMDDEAAQARFKGEPVHAPR